MAATDANTFRTRQQSTGYTDITRLDCVGLSFDEHERLQAWLLDQPEDFLKQTLIAWSLSAAEAKRLKDARIAERKAGGGRVVNDAPAVNAPAAAAGATDG